MRFLLIWTPLMTKWPSQNNRPPRCRTRGLMFSLNLCFVSNNRNQKRIMLITAVEDQHINYQQITTRAHRGERYTWVIKLICKDIIWMGRGHLQEEGFQAGTSNILRESIITADQKSINSNSTSITSYKCTELSSLLCSSLIYVVQGYFKWLQSHWLTFSWKEEAE